MGTRPHAWSDHVKNLELSLPPVAPVRRAYTFVEFFAGIGLTHLGLAPLGWHCTYANDIDDRKRQMYKAQFGDAPYFHLDDVWHTDSVVSRIMGTPDLSTASFPCIDLSLAGNRNGLNGRHSGTFYAFTRALVRLGQQGRLPKAVLVENVLGFLTSHGGRDFKAAVEELAELGYFLDSFVLDARYFTPQSRPRLFIVGAQPCIIPERVLRDPAAAEWRDELKRHPNLRPGSLLQRISKIKLPTGWILFRLPRVVAIKRALDKIIDKRGDHAWWPDDRVAKHLAEMHRRHQEQVLRLQNRRKLTVGTIYRRIRDGQTRSEIRLDGLAGCLRTPRGGSSKQIVFVAGRHSLRMRWMTPLEYARLQGAPKFPIDGFDTNQVLFGFGDAVCVPAISWIARNVLSQMFPP